MARKITNEQMKNLMLNTLLSTKRDVKRTYNNILWCIKNFCKDGHVTEEDLKKALDFELQGRTRTGDDGEKIIFWINKDYSTTDFNADNYNEGIELVHQYMMNKEWYRSLIH